MKTLPFRVLSFSPAAPGAVPAFVPSSEEALLGLSDVIVRVREQIARVAPHFRAALVTGEPHTGAEAVARALHVRSPGKGAPFVVLAAADVDRYLESDDGTSLNSAVECTLLLLDVDQLPAETQAKLLRRMRQRARPLRVVASTHTDLRACVSTGVFSADLADSLSAIRIPMPALRDRKGDLAAITLSMAQRLAANRAQTAPVLHTSFLKAVIEHHWTGNLRELEALLGSLPASTSENIWNHEHFKAALESLAPAAPASACEARLVRLEEVVQEHIRAVLMSCRGNKLRAAEVLGISRSTLYRMLESYSPERLPKAS